MASFKGKEASVETPEETEAQPTRATKTIVLKSGDGQEFEVDESLAMGSDTIKNFMEDDCPSGVTLPLPNVRGSILAEVIEYWTAHSKLHGEGSEKLDARFAGIGRDKMFELILAVNYLAIQPLLDLLCQAVADTIKDMSVEDVRDYFNIKSDYTPEEENEIRKQNAWAFEK